MTFREWLPRPLKWIVGYVDSYGHVEYRLVYEGDVRQKHNDFWPSKIAAHGKFRWEPSRPRHLNTYNDPLDDEYRHRIWDVIDNLLATV